MKWGIASLDLWVKMLTLTGALLPAAGCGGTVELPDQDPKLMTIRLTSPAFADGE